MNAQANPAPPAIDKTFLLALLRQSRDRFLGSFAGLSEEQSRWKPGADRWSVLDTVEHLTTAETIQLRLLNTQRAPRSADAPNREQAFLGMVADRSRKMQSPEAAAPCGRFPTLAAATAQFRATREGVIHFLEQAAEDLRATEVKHPHPAAGMVSVCEMLIIMARHAERHAAQIDEIRNALKDMAVTP
jgi:uncharacterized damage-inducible protein DinB